jgi:hypothetical protein
MPEIEREPFEALSKQEPANPAPADAAERRRRYSLLLEMLEQQLQHTREFMNRAPDPLRKYLDQPERTYPRGGDQRLLATGWHIGRRSPAARATEPSVGAARLVG